MSQNSCAVELVCKEMRVLRNACTTECACGGFGVRWNDFSMGRVCKEIGVTRNKCATEWGSDGIGVRFNWCLVIRWANEWIFR